MLRRKYPAWPSARDRCWIQHDQFHTHNLDPASEGLCSFVGDQIKNPGGGNIFAIKGATMMSDFDHNPHSLKAVIDTLRQYSAQRRLVMLEHAIKT